MKNNQTLTIINKRGKEIPVIDSREVAEMMGKTHSEIIQYLEGLNYKDGRVKITGIIPTLEQSGDLQVANYFLESTYNDRGRTKKCYLVTKMGCELLGNKQQGEKGILFTAKYVERFNEYEKRLEENPYKNLSKELQAIFIHDEKIQKIEEDIKHLQNDVPLYTSECEVLQNKLKAKIVKLLGGKSTPAYRNASLRKKSYIDIQNQIKREFGVNSYKAIARKNYQKALEIIDNYTLPTVLNDQVIKLNNQTQLEL